jgi:hypothetical protein
MEERSTLSVATPSGSYDPVDLGFGAGAKHRGPDLGDSGARNDDEDDEGDDDQDSEHELLMDPNLPEEYELGRRSHAEDGMSDDEDGHGRARFEKPPVEDSPYPEVRAAVRNFDEDLPCNTIRAWTIGLMLIFIGASTNTLFSLRRPSIGINALVAQIIAWPIGHGWTRVMPERNINLFGHRVSLNPGPFNIKEHSIIVVMASVSFSVAYATDIILAQVVFYKQDFGIPFQLLLTISTQSLGYGIAGMMRKFLGLQGLSFRRMT